MLRVAVVSIPLAVCVVAVLPGASDEPVPTSPAEPIDIGNREEPTDTQLYMITKSFCVEMRRHHESGSSKAFRNRYFDPRYLEEHGLKQDNLRVEMAPVVPIRNMVIADDRRTVACYVETTNNQSDRQKEVILFRTTVHEGKLFLLPLKAPDSETGRVTPWILRMKLD